jgi:hypothetical protein
VIWDGAKSRELTSGDPCCRGSSYEVHLFGHSRDLVGDGGSFQRLCAGCEAVLKSRLGFGVSCLEIPAGRKSPVAVLESTSPGEDSTGSGALTPNRRPSSRRASTKEQGTYWHGTYVHNVQPRGGPGGC